jgi:hypothetical protein
VAIGFRENKIAVDTRAPIALPRKSIAELRRGSRKLAVLQRRYDYELGLHDRQIVPTAERIADFERDKNASAVPDDAGSSLYEALHDPFDRDTIDEHESEFSFPDRCEAPMAEIDNDRRHAGPLSFQDYCSPRYRRNSLSDITHVNRGRGNRVWYP